MSERDAATLLRATIALVLGGQAFAMLVHLSVDPRVHAWTSPAMGIVAAVEIGGAVFLCFRRPRAMGGYLLLSSLAAATVLHVLEGERPPTSFLVYAAATWWAIRDTHSDQLRGGG
jgi:hypothetical protein